MHLSHGYHRVEVINLHFYWQPRRLTWLVTAHNAKSNSLGSLSSSLLSCSLLCWHASFSQGQSESVINTLVHAAPTPSSKDAGKTYGRRWAYLHFLTLSTHPLLFYPRRHYFVQESSPRALISVGSVPKQTFRVRASFTSLPMSEIRPVYQYKH